MGNLVRLHPFLLALLDPVAGLREIPQETRPGERDEKNWNGVLLMKYTYRL